LSSHIHLARDEFLAAMRDPNNLIDIHKERNPQRGRRYREPTLNRAVVVLTVAAWQAYVEDLPEAILRTLEPAKGDPGEGLWQLIRAATRSTTGRLNTPNAENTRVVLRNVGFDPRPGWTWRRGSKLVAPPDAAKLVDEWLSVRHKIAHGADLPDVSVLSRTAKGVPTLTRKDAEKCMAFFSQIVDLTTTLANVEFP
jgi:hypothetical protein